jgi:hypothetical protein
MGKIRFAKETPLEFVRMCKRYLIDNGAQIFSQANEFGDLVLHVEGEGIPKGNIAFSLSVEEIVHNVLIINIWP